MPAPFDDNDADGNRLRIGCVSYLNAKPLIDGLAPDTAEVRFDVPANLLDDLLTGAVDLALCPVIDYQRSKEPLVVVPVGAIGSEGQTLTVRVFSRVPFEQVTTIAADTDSHTSVALARIVMQQRFGRAVEIVEYDARVRTDSTPDTKLLIGDKVVHAKPDATEYPYEIDLGQAWHELTDLPFVFATWMARPDTDLGDLPDRLIDLRSDNADRIDAIIERYGASLGWPGDLARDYLGGHIRYELGMRELLAMQKFWQAAADTGVLESVRPLKLFASVNS